MITCDLVLPNGPTGVAEFPSVPREGEQVVLVVATHPTPPTSKEWWWEAGLPENGFEVQRVYWHVPPEGPAKPTVFLRWPPGESRTHS